MRAVELWALVIDSPIACAEQGNIPESFNPKLCLTIAVLVVALRHARMRYIEDVWLSKQFRTCLVITHIQQRRYFLSNFRYYNLAVQFEIEYRGIAVLN